MPILMIAALALFCAAPLCAEVVVGKPAPYFKVDGDNVNEPELKNLNDCKGEVILIADWHVRDVQSQKLVKTVQGLWDKYRDKGLHVFMTHRLNMERLDPVADYCARNRLTFCVPICAFGETNDFDAYFVKDRMHITVIGVDGNVLFHAVSGGWQQILENELKKVVYPHLLRQSVAKALEPAAKQFGSGAFGRAVKLAQAKLEEELDEGAKDDARHILKRAEQIHERKRKRIDAAKDRRHYVQALAWLEDLQKCFRDTEIATEAEKEIKALKADRKVKDELKAQESLIHIVGQSRDKEKSIRINTLRAFAKNFPGTRAAEDAEEMAGRLERAQH